MPAAVVQRRDWMTGAVNPQDQEAEEQIQNGQLTAAGFGRHAAHLLHKLNPHPQPLESQGIPGFHRSGAIFRGQNDPG